MLAEAPRSQQCLLICAPQPCPFRALSPAALDVLLAQIPPPLQPLFLHQAQVLNDYLRTVQHRSALLGALYAGLGSECGGFMRALQTHNLSWGSFTDLTGVHCNAHCNNFVIRAPSDGDGTLLAPVDFDLRYAASAYICPHGTAAEHIAMEVHTLGMDLGGSQDTSGTKNNHAVPERAAALRWLLRDTAITSYVQAMAGAVQPDLADDVRRASSALLAMALIVTLDVVA
jgi:hypothetical protein